MANKKKIYARYGATDFIQDESKEEVVVPKYVTVFDAETGKEIGDIELTLICFEDEEGNECDEEGNEY